MKKYARRAGRAASSAAVLAACIWAATGSSLPALAAERTVLVEEFTNTY